MKSTPKFRNLVIGFSMVLVVLAMSPSLFAKGKPPKPDPEPTDPPNPVIAFWEVSQNHQKLIVTDSDGSNPNILLTSPDALAYPEFSPTENAIAYSDNGTLRLLHYSVSDTSVEVDSIDTIDATTFCYQSDISPDGQWIVYKAEGGRILLKSMSDLDGNSTWIFGAGGSGNYSWNAVWLNTPGLLAISYNQTGIGNEIIVVSLDLDTPDIGINSVVAGPLSLSGLDISVPNIEASRETDDVIVSVKMKTGQIWGKGKNRYEIEGHVVHVWMSPLDSEGGVFGLLTGPGGEIVVGETPCFSPDDSSVLGYDEYRGDLIATSLLDGSVTSIASGRIRHSDWKRPPPTATP